MTDIATYSHPVVMADRVLDLGVLRIDEKKAAGILESVYDNWARCGCTAVARMTDDGKVLVGRNMDLSISDKPAYTFILDTCRYKARGLAYSHITGEDFATSKNGVSERFATTIPYAACDYLNEKGLYMETNMRGAQYGPDGKPVFGCSGTNPGSDTRLLIISFSAYAITRCANVNEVLELVKTVDLYTPIGTSIDWNFSYLIADAEGRYGVLEAIDNGIFFTTYEDGYRVCYDVKADKVVDKEKVASNAIAQANFFTVKKYEEMEVSGAGYGRYKTVLDGIDDVNTIEQMKCQMRKIYYSQSYLPYGESKFDVRSEWCDTIEGPDGKKYTTRWLLDSRNGVKAEEAVKSGIADRAGWTYQQKIDSKNYWNSVFSIVADCKERKLHVTFWEDDKVFLVLGI